MKYVVTIGYRRFEGFKDGTTALAFAEMAKEHVVENDSFDNTVTVIIEKEEEQK